jgi:hypothetical protein
LGGSPAERSAPQTVGPNTHLSVQRAVDMRS